MKHIRVSENRLVNPDAFATIVFWRDTGGTAFVSFCLPGQHDVHGLLVQGPDAERVWERLKRDGDELERRAAAFAEIETQQRKLMDALGLVDRSIREYAGTGEAK